MRSDIFTSETDILLKIDDESIERSTKRYDTKRTVSRRVYLKIAGALALVLLIVIGVYFTRTASAPIQPEEIEVAPVAAPVEPRKAVAPLEDLLPYVKIPGFEKNPLVGTGYHFKNFLGVGAFGVVMTVEKHGKEYAVKMVSKAAHSKQKRVPHLFAERDCQIKIGNKAGNPYVPSVHQTFQTDELACIVMDKVKGQELWQLFNDRSWKPTPEDVTRLWVAEILVCLEDLHSQKMAYRDLKLENLIISADGHLHMCDFGMAKVLETAEEKLKEFTGTPECMSPEVVECLDEHPTGYRLEPDLWTLGILLGNIVAEVNPVEMPSGEGAKQKLYDAIRQETADLYEREGQWKHFNKRVNNQEKYGLSISEECKNLIAGLLTHDPSKRMGCTGHNQYNSPKSIFEHEWFKGTGLTFETLKTKQYHKINNWNNLERQLKELNVPEYAGFTSDPEQYQLDSINKIQKEGEVEEALFKEWSMTL